MTTINATSDMLNWCLPTDFAKFVVQAECWDERDVPMDERDILCELTGMITPKPDREFTLPVDARAFARSVVMNCLNHGPHGCKKFFKSCQYTPDGHISLYDSNNYRFCHTKMGFNPLPDGRTNATRTDVEGWG